MKKLSIPKNLNFDKGGGLIPLVIQDARSSAVLTLGYADREALQKTVATGRAWFYSRTKKRLRMKGEVSGNVLLVQEILPDCDRDALLIKVVPTGPACHLGTETCFREQPKKDVLRGLFSLIVDRKKKMPKGSYATSLFKSGLDKICLKVAEEALEVVHAAQKQTRERVIEESGDLLYHLFVFLVEKRISLEEVCNELVKRSLPFRNKKGVP